MFIKKIVNRIEILNSSVRIVNLCFEHYPSVALDLIKQFKSINVENIDNLGTPISWIAVEYDSAKLLAQILQTFNSESMLINVTGDLLLHKAVEKGAMRCISYIIKNHKQLINSNGAKKLILHRAVKFGQDTCVEYLIRNTNIEVNQVDEELNTPLHVAVQYGQIRCGELLVAAKANISARNKTKKTPSELAIETKNKQFITLLSKAQTIETSTQLIDESVAKIRIAAFQGGGVKGAGFLGALSRLLEQKVLDLSELEIVAGTSAGAITALLLAVGYDKQELESIVKTINFYDLLEIELKEEFFKIKAELNQHNGIEKFLGPTLYKFFNKIKTGNINKDSLKSIFIDFIGSELLPFGIIQKITESLGVHDAEFQKLKTEINTLKKRLSPFLNHFHNGHKGLFAGNVLREQFANWLKRKNLNENLTFKDLYHLSLADKRYKNLYVAAYDANERRTVIFSYETTPSDIIIDATRCSMSIQLFFEPHARYQLVNGKRIPHAKNHILFDGGSLDNYILNYFDKVRYTHSIRDFSSLSIHSDNKVSNQHAIGFRLLGPDMFNYYEMGADLPDYANVTTLDFILSILSSITSFTKQESDYILHPDEHARTVCINTLDIGTVEFDITGERTAKLIASGDEGAELFLKRYFKKPVDYAFEVLRQLIPSGTNDQKFVLPLNLDERFNLFTNFAIKLTKADFYSVINCLGISIQYIRNIQGDSLLHYAIKTGNLVLLDKLFTNKHDLNIQNNQQLFPVDCITECKDLEKILHFISDNDAFYSKFLSDAKVNLDSNAQKINYLLWFIHKQSQLSKNNVNLYSSSQRQAVFNLLKSMADVNVKVDISKYSQYDLLNYVYTLVSYNACHLIRKLGLLIDQADKNGMTVLHYFVLNNQQDEIDQCLQHYAFKHPLNKSNESPLDLSLKITSFSAEDTRTKQSEIAIFLIKRGIVRCLPDTRKKIEVLFSGIVDIGLVKIIKQFNEYDQNTLHENEYQEFKKQRQYAEIIIDAKFTDLAAQKLRQSKNYVSERIKDTGDENEIEVHQNLKQDHAIAVFDDSIGIVKDVNKIVEQQAGENTLPSTSLTSTLTMTTGDVFIDKTESNFLPPPPPPPPKIKTQQLLSFMNRKNTPAVELSEHFSPKQPHEGEPQVINLPLLDDIRQFSSKKLKQVNLTVLEESIRKNKKNNNIFSSNMSEILMKAMGDRRFGMLQDEDEQYQVHEYTLDDEWGDILPQSLSENTQETLSREKVAIKAVTSSPQFTVPTYFQVPLLDNDGQIPNNEATQNLINSAKITSIGSYVSIVFENQESAVQLQAELLILGIENKSESERGRKILMPEQDGFEIRLTSIEYDFLMGEGSFNQLHQIAQASSSNSLFNYK